MICLRLCIESAGSCLGKRGATGSTAQIGKSGLTRPGHREHRVELPAQPLSAQLRTDFDAAADRALAKHRSGMEGAALHEAPPCTQAQGGV